MSREISKRMSRLVAEAECNNSIALREAIADLENSQIPAGCVAVPRELVEELINELDITRPSYWKDNQFICGVCKKRTPAKEAVPNHYVTCAYGKLQAILYGEVGG